jgi:endoglucanase
MLNWRQHLGMRLSLGLIVVLPLVLFGCAEEPSIIVQGRPARGINLGNALEAPNEGEWGLVLQERHFALIRQAGFDLVRVPIRFSAHAAQTPPYTLDPTFMARIDWVVEQALRHKLIVVLDMHHYEELIADPAGQRERFLALWRQIASRYRGSEQRVWFELLNEPNGALYGDRWNALAADGIAAVRESNPTRKLVVGPGNWNQWASLVDLDLPDDPNLIVTIHYYEPFRFTHQGAEWVPGAEAWLGTPWGSEAEQRQVRQDLEMAQTLAAQRGWQLLLGEFGAYGKADMESRVRWTRTVRAEAEARGMAWAYWELGAGFGAYDREADAWREELLRALVPEG